MGKVLAKKCQKEPKFGFPRRHVAEPGEAGRSVVTSEFQCYIHGFGARLDLSYKEGI